MKEFFSISQTAKIAGVTSETLRHYDRIGLVKPCKVDEWTGYRYYSQQEIVRLNTIHALRCMDLSLAEIKEILSYEDFRKITEKLKLAEKKADEKIAELNNAKNRIRRARTFYESKLSSQPPAESFLMKHFPQRVILLSDSLESPTLDNLWNYHRHFYSQLPAAMKDKFAFEDLAGVYEQDGQTRLFPVCAMPEIHAGKRAQKTSAGQLSVRRLYGTKLPPDCGKAVRNGEKQIQYCSGIYFAVHRSFQHIAMELSDTDFYSVTMQETIKQALRSCNACLRFSVDLGAPEAGRFYYFSARLPAKQVKPIAGSALFILKSNPPA